MKTDSPRELVVAVAENIRVARKAAHISQQQLADAAGISRATIAQIEGGRYKSLSLATLERISLALGIAEIDLLRRANETLPDSLLPFQQSPWFLALKPATPELAKLARILKIMWPRKNPEPEAIAELLQFIRRSATTNEKM